MCLLELSLPRLVSTELEGIWKEAILAKFKAMFQYLFGWTHVMHGSWYRSWDLNLLLPDHCTWTGNGDIYTNGHWMTCQGAEFSFRSWHSLIWSIPCFQATTGLTLDSQDVAIYHCRPVELGAHPDTHLH